MDIERIRDKLSEIKVYLIELDEDIPEDKGEYLEERVTRRACERTFQLACEDVIDICNLIITGCSGHAGDEGRGHGDNDGGA